MKNISFAMPYHFSNYEKEILDKFLQREKMTIEEQNETKEKTIRKLENLKRDLFPHLETLDGTWSECVKCHRKTYTSRIESLTRVNIRNIIKKIDLDIEHLRNSDNIEEDELD